MKYPFVKCLDPKSIVNPYNNERLLVECGKCKACRIRKAGVNSLKCKLESLSHKYCMFVTLTYSNTAVPLMNVEFGKKFNEPDLIVSYSSRLGVGEILGEVDVFEKDIDSLKVKCNTFNLLPYLSKRDLQLFIKRLRKYLSKYDSESIRYYGVGELGPVHYRPHYHLLLWFSSEKIYKVIEQAVSSCWRYGRVDVETSRGAASDYVASYVNSTCNLPRVYQQKKTKPFAIHSNHLGEMVLQKSRKEIYEMPVRDFVERRVPIADAVTDVNLWRSLKAYYFPRCKAYSVLTEFQRLQAYRTFDEARRIFKTESLVEITDNILSRIVEFNRDFEILDINPFWSWKKDEERLVRYFVKSAQVNAYDLETPETYDKYFRKIYMELRLSRHFINFCCGGDISKTSMMYKKIEAFWNEVDMLNLSHMYEDMQTFCDEWYEDEEDLQMFWANREPDITEYKNKLFYERFYFQSESHYEMSIKHKKLNDMNKIFENK